MVYMYGYYTPTPDAEEKLKKCPNCRYKLLNDGWCSNCDMATFVKLRDHQYTCKHCKGGVYKMKDGTFESEEGLVICPMSPNNHEPDQEEIDWIAEELGSLREPAIADRGPDENSVGHFGEWGLIDG